MNTRPYAAPRRATQKAETRTRIVQAAARLCARRGFAATRTLDVANAARVSHGAVFAHFQSRDRLMTAVVAELARQITDPLHAIDSSRGGLDRALAAHLEVLADCEDQLRWLLLEAPLLPKGLNVAWLGLQSAVASHLAPAVERDIAEGRIRPVTLPFLLNTWTGLVHHYVLNRELFSPGKSVLRTRGPELLAQFLDLVSQSGRYSKRSTR